LTEVGPFFISGATGGRIEGGRKGKMAFVAVPQQGGGEIFVNSDHVTHIEPDRPSGSLLHLDNGQRLISTDAPDVLAHKFNLAL
jgi:hypothetical protein